MIGLGLDDLFRLRWIDAPRVAPNIGGVGAARVAWLETGLDVATDRVWTRAMIDGQALDVPDPVDLAWSPDGRRLALCGRDGSWMADGDGGSLRRVLDGPAAELAWSPDGQLVSFARADRVSVVGARFAEIATDGQVTCPIWSPDGLWLAYVADSALWLAAAEGGAPRRVATPAEVVDAVAWAPDSSALAVLGRAERALVDVSRRWWRLHLATGTAHELPRDPDAALGSAVRGDDPRGTGRPALCWSAATGRIYTEAARHGRGPLVWCQPESGEDGLLLDGEHAVFSPSLVADGRLVAIVCGPDGPGDAWLVDERSEQRRRVSTAGDDLVGLASPTRSITIAGVGGRVDAWLTGASETPSPLIANIHGGPYYAVGWRFTFEVQRLAARGVHVLTMNPRGSSGRGDVFAAGNRGDWGGVDAADAESVIEAVAACPEVDAARIALWGVSYGGFMTQWLLGRSNRYRTAISENGISDFEAMCAARPDPFWALALGESSGQTLHLHARSPVRVADRIRTPLLLVHAEDDMTCPIEQSELMATALPDAQLVRLPGEGHLINLVGRPSSRRRRATAVDAWLDRTLG